MPAEKELPVLITERLVLRMPAPDEARAVIEYFQTNKEHLANSAPRYADNFFEENYWRRQLAANVEEFQADTSLRLFIFERLQDAHGSNVVGSANFNGIIRRAAQFCYLGYGLAAGCEGKGYMTEALRAAIGYAFNEMNLHRIMANYVPHNQRSGRVLKGLGFTPEGFARDYLYLNGAWQDHVLTSLTNHAWQEALA